MPRKKNEGREVVPYKHPLDKELGLINLVIPAPDDPDDQVCMILTSERSVDEGVIFTVGMYNVEYAEMCEDEGITTLEGCILSTFGERIQLEEIPETPPTPRKDQAKSPNNLRVLATPNMWKHAWGRCCCVKRGDEYVPVTSDTIADGSVPFWNNIFTPYELDMIDAARDPANKAMHVLPDTDFICGRCGHNAWIVYDEVTPSELPTPPKYIDVQDPLCDDQQALDEIPWSSKAEAWEIFYNDDHNNKIVMESGLAIERANNRKRFSQEKAFEPFNKSHGLGHNMYTVKQAFYAALGNSRSGTWADLDLGMLRLVKGIEEVDIPAEILDMVRLDDEHAQQALQEKTEHRAVKATVDEEATILQFMMDDEAALGDEDDDDDSDDGLVDIDVDDVPSVIEPKRQRPKAMPVVRKPRPATTNRPRLNKTVPRSSSAKKTAKKNLITACISLQEALSSFVKTLQDDEEDDEGSGGSRSSGG